MKLVRVAMYTVGALAGVYVVNELRPVQLNPAAAAAAAGAGVDTAFEQLFKGNWSAAGNALVGGAKAAGGSAHDQVQGQVRSNVIAGVVGGCALAGLVDAFLVRT